jgi:hypothetical protein
MHGLRRCDSELLEDLVIVPFVVDPELVLVKVLLPAP